MEVAIQEGWPLMKGQLRHIFTLSLWALLISDLIRKMTYSGSSHTRRVTFLERTIKTYFYSLSLWALLISVLIRKMAYSGSSHTRGVTSHERTIKTYFYSLSASAPDIWLDKKDCLVRGVTSLRGQLSSIFTLWVHLKSGLIKRDGL